jgi:hypothetical protein
MWQFLPTQPCEKAGCVFSANMSDFEAKAAGCTMFSKVDLSKGYLQIPANPENITKMAIATPLHSKGILTESL